MCFRWNSERERERDTERERYREREREINSYQILVRRIYLFAGQGNGKFNTNM
jgi:hypothetical protein